MDVSAIVDVRCVTDVGRGVVAGVSATVRCVVVVSCARVSVACRDVC